MAERGGYRAPANPSPVPMPGKLSRRTDGGASDPEPLRGDGSYGESKDLAGLQSSAPMQQKREPFLAPFSGPGFADPSNRPFEPVTQGADAGIGAGSEILGLPNEQMDDARVLAKYLPALEFMANRPQASPTLRAAVRAIKGRL